MLKSGRGWVLLVSNALRPACRIALAPERDPDRSPSSDSRFALEGPNMTAEERELQSRSVRREVNERVAEVATHYIEVETHAEMVKFTCECGRVDCADTIGMTIAEYEAIRAESTHFGVVPQHEQPEIETVIERHPSYFVVEKRQRDAQEVARETDPRT